MLNIHRGRDRMGPPLLFQWTAKDLLPKSPVPGLLGAQTMPDVMLSNLVYSSMESVSGGATTSLWKIKPIKQAITMPSSRLATKNQWF